MPTKNILIADDDPSIIMIVSHIVKRAGFVAVTARDGKEAHRLLRETSIDLVITDEAMPHATGTEIARWMRGQADLRNVPVIIMSAEQNPAAFDKAIADKLIDGFLHKPFNSKALSELLKLYMKD